MGIIKLQTSAACRASLSPSLALLPPPPKKLPIAIPILSISPPFLRHLGRATNTPIGDEHGANTIFHPQPNPASGHRRFRSYHLVFYAAGDRGARMPAFP